MLSGIVLRSMSSNVMVSKFGTAEELASAGGAVTGCVPIDAVEEAAGSVF